VTFGQAAHLDELEPQRLDAVQEPVELGLIAHGAVEDRFHPLDGALHVVEGCQHALAHATADADLVVGLRHAPSRPRASRLSG
jgi:hypothetical protein